MRIGIVLGSIWATRKHPSLAGQTFLRVRLHGDELIAVDHCGAGVGEQVLITLGSAARSETSLPVDAAIVAILDQTEGAACPSTESSS